MATIKDIAKMAGVSHGTVSNVLNRKGNVRSDKIQRVEAIAKKLGYHMNTQAQSLRRGLSNKILIFVPFTLRNIYQSFHESMHALFRHSHFELSIVYVDNSVLFEESLQRELALRPKAMIFLGFCPKERYLAEYWEEIYIAVVDYYETIESPHIKRLSFCKEQVQEDIRKYCEEKGVENILMLMYKGQETVSLPAKIKEDLGENFFVTTYLISREENLLSLFQKMNDVCQFDLILSGDYQLTRELLQMFQWFSLENHPKVLTIDAKRLLRSKMDYYQLDYKYFALRVAKQIKAKEREQEIEGLDLCVRADGFVGSLNLICEEEEVELRLLSIHSPTSEAIRILSHKFFKESNIKVCVDSLSYEEFYHKISSTPHELQQYDLIRMDVALLQSLGKNVFQTLNSYIENYPFIKKIETKLLKEYMYIGQDLYTLPLDVSVQMLFYRKDLFQDKFFQRKFYEKHKMELRVPTSFEEFDRISQFFFQELSPGNAFWGNSIAGKSAIVTACDFLPRYREQLLVETEELAFEKALSAYVRSFEYSDGKYDKWWGEIAEDFAQGKTSMAIIFSNYASQLCQRIGSIPHLQLGIAKIPGSQPLNGGGCIGITKYSSKRKLALRFLEWLYSDEIAEMVVNLGGMILSPTVMKSENLKEMFPWISHLKSSLKIGSRIWWKEKEYSIEFEQALGNKVREALKITRK